MTKSFAKKLTCSTDLMLPFDDFYQAVDGLHFHRRESSRGGLTVYFQRSIVLLRFAWKIIIVNQPWKIIEYPEDGEGGCMD